MKRRKKKDHIIIVGCGRLGSSIASALCEQDLNVSVIDISPDSFRKLPPSYSGFTAVGDGTDTDVLQQSDVTQADVLIACTDVDDINIMAAQVAKEIFKVKKVVARIKDTSKTVAFLGMDILTICPAMLSTLEFLRILENNPEKGEAGGGSQ